MRGGSFYGERAKNVLKRAMVYMLMAGAVVASLKGSALSCTLQPLNLLVEALSQGRRSHGKV